MEKKQRNYDTRPFNDEDIAKLRNIKDEIHPNLDQIDGVVKQYEFSQAWKQRVRIWITVWAAIASIFATIITLFGNAIKDMFK